MSTTTTSTTTYADVIEYITNHASYAEIDQITQVSRNRFMALGRAQAATLAIGDEVTMHNISPKYLQGLTGTVEEIDTRTEMIAIRLDAVSTTKLQNNGRQRRYFISPLETNYLLTGIPMVTTRPA